MLFFSCFSVGSESIGVSQLLRLVADTIDQNKKKEFTLSYEELGRSTEEPQLELSKISQAPQNLSQPQVVSPRGLVNGEKQSLMLRYTLFTEHEF
jgi:hypothetical protein